MKRLLIISPYFPPTNTADMQRVRLSLPYFSAYGWEAEVVTVDESHPELAQDPLLLRHLPASAKVHKVRALAKQWTAKAGLGSLALRSLWFYRLRVNQLLRNKQFDLIYFSTTQFPVCLLGAYWKRKFGIPYVIDFQDPWHSDYYLDKPKSQRPPKYWFSYRLNKYLEPIALRQVDGLISVSKAYLSELSARYPVVQSIPKTVIPFGFEKKDLALALAHQHDYPDLLAKTGKNLVYIGRGGADMHRSVTPLLMALRAFISSDKYGSPLHVYFIGTSYAPKGTGRESIMPLARSYDLQDHVTEITDRIPFYHALVTLQNADALFIPGSDDPKYTASKLYPYLLAAKPLLAVFNEESPALQTLRSCGAAFAYGYNQKSLETAIQSFLEGLTAGLLPEPRYDQTALAAFDAANMTRLQCDLFNQVVP